MRNNLIMLLRVGGANWPDILICEIDLMYSRKFFPTRIHADCDEAISDLLACGAKERWPLW